MQNNFSLPLFSKYLFIVITLILAIWLFSKQQVKVVKLEALNNQQCNVIDSQGTQTFDVYLPTNWHVSLLAKAFCETALKGSIYKQVSISWQPRESLGSDLIISQKFNLMMHRVHALTGLLPNWQDFYKQSINLPSYQIFWFSHQQNISLTRAFFKDKRIGLLADKKSASGYLVPMSQISQSGISLSAAQLHLYPNREALLDDFLQQKIDLIPNIPYLPKLINWPSDKKLLITESSTLPSWFISKSTSENLTPKIISVIKEYQSTLFNKQP